MSTVAPIFSLSSRTIRSAVFLPIPVIAWKRAESSRTIARRSSSAGEPAERELFEHLLAVSGVGPKVALAIVSG